MKYIRELFKFDSDECRYKNTVITYVIANVCLGIIIFLDYLIRELVVSRIILGIVFILIMYLFISFIIRLIAISDNRETVIITQGKYKQKYDPINVKLDDLTMWIQAMAEPEKIICSIESEFFTIEISYDVEGKRGPYYNRQIYLNNQRIDVFNLIKILSDKATDGNVSVYETFDHNKPQILVDEIENLKRN